MSTRIGVLHFILKKAQFEQQIRAKWFSFWRLRIGLDKMQAQHLISCINNSVCVAGSHYRLQVTDVLWSCVCRCWAERVYLPPLAHRFWKLTLQLLSRYATFLTEVRQIKHSACADISSCILLFLQQPNLKMTDHLTLWRCRRVFYHLSAFLQVLTKTPPSETTKEATRPLPSSASSTSSRTSQDADSESGGTTVLSTKQLVFIAADVDQLQEQVPMGQHCIEQNVLEMLSFFFF